MLDGNDTDQHDYKQLGNRLRLQAWLSLLLVPIFLISAGAVLWLTSKPLHDDLAPTMLIEDALSESKDGYTKIIKYIGNLYDEEAKTNSTLLTVKGKFFERLAEEDKHIQTLDAVDIVEYDLQDV